MPELLSAFSGDSFLREVLVAVVGLFISQDASFLQPLQTTGSPQDLVGA